MKNATNKMLLAIVIILMAIIIAMSVIAINSFHSRVAVVTEIDEENDMITVTCGNGNVFSFHDTSEDWICGDLCSLLMYDNLTEHVYDDIVVSARYGGYLELFEKIVLPVE